MGGSRDESGLGEVLEGLGNQPPETGVVEGGGDLGVAGGVGRLAQVGDGHAGSKGAGKLDVDGCFTGLDDIRIDEIGDGARVVDRRVIKALVGLVGLAEEAEKADDELRDWGLQSLDFCFDLQGGKRLVGEVETCLLYTSPSPRDRQKSRMPSSA